PSWSGARRHPTSRACAPTPLLAAPRSARSPAVGARPAFACASWSPWSEGAAGLRRLTEVLPARVAGSQARVRDPDRVLRREVERGGQAQLAAGRPPVPGDERHLYAFGQLARGSLVG